MIVAGERTVPGDPAAVALLLGDLRVVAERLPIVTAVDEASADRLRATIRPQTSLGATSFTVDATVERPTAEGTLRYRIAGRRSENVMRMLVEIGVTPSGDGSLIRWRAEVSFFGVLAAVGQRALPAVAADQLDALFAAASTS